MNNRNIKRSYGIICCRYNVYIRKIEILFIRKRNSYHFIEFIMGKYKKNDNERLIYLFNNMTNDEKIDILLLDFDKLWFKIWINKNDKDPGLHQRYLQHKSYFEQNFLPDKGKRLRLLLNKTHNINTVWELPKGRKANPQERGLECALREFEEETNISRHDITLLDIGPFTIQNKCSHVTYISNYYISIINNYRNDKFHKLFYSDNKQISEVVDIQWMDIDQIRLVDHTKKIHTLTKQINKILRKKYKLKKIYELKLI